MNLFLIFATLLVLIVLALLLPPLWRGRRSKGEEAQRKESNLAIFRSQLAELEREKTEGDLDEKTFEQARQELQRRLLDEVADNPEAAPAASSLPSRKMAIVVTIVLPLIASAAYLTLGNFRALDPIAVAQQATMTPDQIKGMVDKLAQRLRDNPGDTEGWLMLARSYKSMERPAEAAEAYEKAGAAVYESPDLLTDYADVLAMMNGGSLNGKPMELINKALHLDPDHVVALWLAGTAAYSNKNFSAAVVFWERAIKVLPPESEDAQMLAEGVTEAKKRMSAKADAKKSVGGQVVLSPALKDSVAPGDTVFIFARAADGSSRMPIAIAKARVSDLPYAFVLDDTSAMMAENTLSKQSKVIVVARISKTGNAMPKEGDLESAPQTVALGESKLRVVVDRKL